MNAPFMHIMRRQACCPLLKLPKQRVRQWVNTFETAIFDADGVLWHLNEPIEGAADVLNAFKAMGKRVYICTNNSTITCEQITEKANCLGYLITNDEILTSAKAAASYLQQKDFQQRVYLIGEQGIATELEAAGIQFNNIGRDVMTKANILDFLEQPHDENQKDEDEKIGAVLVGQDMHFSVPKLMRAANYLQNPDCLFLALNRDAAFPLKNGKLIPGAGPIVAAVKTCANRKPLTLGKPNPFMCAELIRCGLIKPETTLMVGDTLYTDILFGYNCGFQTLFVTTGVSTLEDVREAQQSESPKQYKLIPDVYLPSLGDLLPFLPFKPCK